MLVANIKKNILFIHFESHKYLTGKRDYVKARYMTDVRENYTGKKNILFIHIVCVWIFDAFGFIAACAAAGAAANM